ncbi:MAG: TonB-dependent receptor [Candidatus Eisenbacteria bacterium]
MTLAHRLRRALAGLGLLLPGMLLVTAPATAGSVSTATSKEKGPDPKKAIVLPEIVVTADRPILEDTRLDRLGGLVTIMGPRQISDMNALDLPSALRRLPGVAISRYDLVGGYGGGDGGAVYIRGLGSGRPGAEVSTLFDGIPRFVGVWTHPIMDALSLESSGGIEVRKSAQPVLQGNMAFGTVNLVPLRRTAPGYETSVEGAFGRYNTSSGVIRHGGQTGRFDYYLSAGRNRSDGQRDLAAGRTESLYGRAGYQIAQGWDWNFQVEHTDGKDEDPGSTKDPWPLADPAFRVPTFRTDTELYLATMAHRIGPATGTVKVYLEDGHLDWLQWDSPGGGAPAQSFTTMTDYQNYGLHLQESVPLPAAVALTLGYDQDFYGGKTRNKLATGDQPESAHQFRNRAPYLALARTFPLASDPVGGWHLTPSIGARYNDSRFFGSDWGWQGGVTAERGRTRLNIQHSRAFNLPGVYVAAMYDSWGRPDEWKSLSPELLDHNEVGLRFRPYAKCDLEVNAFYDEVRSALHWVPPVIPPPPPFQPPRFDNDGRYINRGVETSLSTEAGSSTLFAGVTLMHPTPKDLPNAPDWAVTAGFNSRLTRALGLSLDAAWCDAQFILNPRFAAPADYESPTARVKRHFVLNGRLGYRLPINASQAELFLACENITGERYEYRPGYPMPRQVWMSGLKADF